MTHTKQKYALSYASEDEALHALEASLHALTPERRTMMQALLEIHGGFSLMKQEGGTS